jgi:hypothetical protein
MWPLSLFRGSKAHEGGARLRSNRWLLRVLEARPSKKLPCQLPVSASGRWAAQHRDVHATADACSCQYACSLFPMPATVILLMVMGGGRSVAETGTSFCSIHGELAGEARRRSNGWPDLHPSPPSPSPCTVLLHLKPCTRCDSACRWQQHGADDGPAPHVIPSPSKFAHRSAGR